MRLPADPALEREKTLIRVQQNGRCRRNHSEEAREMARIVRPRKQRTVPSTPLQAMLEEYIESLAVKGFSDDTRHVRRSFYRSSSVGRWNAG
jgi:hypothetical protein